MKKEDIHFGDINRWLFGQAPPEFMIEVFLRTILIYLFLLAAVRLMGKRMSGQITLTELAVMITLGAIVSPVMQLPDRALVFGIIALGIALLFQRQFNLRGFKSEAFEKLTQGNMKLLVKDGEIDIEQLKKSHLSHQQLLAMLRSKGIENLGKVRRAYLEACGILSVFTDDAARPGLPIYPQKDQDILQSQTLVNHGAKVCCNCGHVQQVDNLELPCEVCADIQWNNAYLSKK